MNCARTTKGRPELAPRELIVLAGAAGCGVGRSFELIEVLLGVDGACWRRSGGDGGLVKGLRQAVRS